MACTRTRVIGAGHSVKPSASGSARDGSAVVGLPIFLNRRGRSQGGRGVRKRDCRSTSGCKHASISPKQRGCGGRYVESAYSNTVGDVTKGSCAKHMPPVRLAHPTSGRPWLLQSWSRHMDYEEQWVRRSWRSRYFWCSYDKGGMAASAQRGGGARSYNGRLSRESGSQERRTVGGRLRESNCERANTPRVISMSRQSRNSADAGNGPFDDFWLWQYPIAHSVGVSKAGRPRRCGWGGGLWTPGTDRIITAWRIKRLGQARGDT